MPYPVELHPTEAQLSDFDLGHLPPAEWTAVESHVAACATCCEKLERVPDDPLLRLIHDAHADTPAETLPQANTPTQSPAPRPVTQTPAALIDHPRYRILGYLGGGGLGAVFQAEHRLMDRRVALKIIKPALIAHPEAVERFRLEIKAAARLSHPAIVAAFDAEQAGDLHFLVTEFVEGADLDRLVQCEGLPTPAEACDWVAQAALGLQHAHERGTIHRDLKPSNLLRTPEGRIKILDFGLARFVSEAPAAPFTPSDVMVGTPDFMAPEQALDPRRADIRSDIYSLGCTLYFLLTGRPPFPGGTAVQKLLDHQDQTPAPLAELRPEASNAVTAVLLRMMAKAPQDRYQTPQEAAAALQAVVRSEPGSPPPAARESPPRLPPSFASRGVLWGLLAGSVLLVLSGLAVVVGWRASGPRPMVANVEPSAVAVAPTTPPTAAEYRGKIDLRVWHTGPGQKPNQMRLSESGALPLHPGDKLRIHVQVQPAGYVYLFWIDTEGVVLPVYPGDPGKWGTRPEPETPVDRLELPPRASFGYKIVGDQVGMETLVMLVRDEPLLSGEETAVRRDLSGLPPQRPVQNPLAAVWFENGRVVDHDPERLRASFEVEDINDPVLRLQDRLMQQLQPHGRFTAAVSFARLGE